MWEVSTTISSRGGLRGTGKTGDSTREDRGGGNKNKGGIGTGTTVKHPAGAIGDTTTRVSKQQPELDHD